MDDFIGTPPYGPRKTSETGKGCFLLWAISIVFEVNKGEII